MIQRSACMVAGSMLHSAATSRTASAMARYSRLFGASFPSPAARHIQTSTTTACVSPAMARAKAFVLSPRSPLNPSATQRSAAATWERRPFGVMPCAYWSAFALLWAQVTRGENADTTLAATSRFHPVMGRSELANAWASLYHASAACRSKRVAEERSERNLSV